MFEEFSSGYYLGRLYVQPRDGEGAVMEARDHDRTVQHLYGDEVDDPLVMKLGSMHFPVHAAPDVPGHTLALPPNLLEQSPIDRPPELSEVFLAKPDRASQLLELA
ncbi:MAG: DUF5802 family protein [Halobacteriaceae archaeon]